MKLPALQLGQGGLVDLLIRNGEKIGGAIVAVVVSLLLWQAVSALRLQSVQKGETAETISLEATQADANVARAQEVPDDLLPPHMPLAERIEVWRSGKPRELAAGELPLLDQPLFSELSRRDKPAALPIENLQVLSGVAVLPEQQGQAPPPRRGADLRQRNADMAAGADLTRVKVTPYVVLTGLVPVAKQLAEHRRCFAAAQFQDPERDLPVWSQYKLERAVEGPGGVGRWENVPVTALARPGGAAGGDMTLTASDGVPPSFLLGGAGEVAYAGPLPQRLDEPWGAASIHPWFAERLRKALDDGLFDEVPVEEIANVTLQELKATPDRFLGKTVRLEGVVLAARPTRVRDVGLFSYSVKDATGVQAGNPKVGTSRDLAITTSEQFGNFLELGGAEGANGATAVGPPGGGAAAAGRDCHLVVRLDSIGRTPVARIQEIEFLNPTGEVMETQVETSAGLLDSFGQGIDGYGMDPAYGMMNTGGGVSFAGDGGAGMPGMPGAVQGGFEYRLFRFVDLTVQPGRTYRYRVTLAMRNPNFDLPPQYLASADDARGQFLLSPPSESSPAVTVPDTTAMLVGLLGPDEVKRHKVRPGQQEVLVLAPDVAAGRPTLRAVLVDKGGVADVDSSLNRPSTVRSRGEDVKTGRLLVDVFGQQSDRTGAGARRVQIVEPVEMLFLRPDGRFEVVSAADSEQPLARYRTTLEGEVERDPSMPETEMAPDTPGFPFPARPGRPSR